MVASEERCRFCGCTRGDPCRVPPYNEGDECAWLPQAAGNVCSAPQCALRWGDEERVQAKRRADARQKKRAPWQVHALIQQERRERRKASRLRAKAAGAGKKVA